MRWALSWVLWWIGDKISDLDGAFGERLSLYGPYNWLMLASERVQGKGRGPWQDVTP